MKVVNYGDPFTQKINIRLSEPQLRFVNQYCTSMHISQSNLFRSLLDRFIYSSGEEIVPDENIQTDLNDQLQYSGLSPG